jgi:hypothetical protein
MATFKPWNSDQFMDDFQNDPFTTIRELALDSLYITASFIYFACGLISFIVVYFLKFICNELDIDTSTDLDLDKSAIAKALSNLISNSLYMVDRWIVIAGSCFMFVFIGSLLFLLKLADNLLRMIGDLQELLFALLLHTIYRAPLIQSRDDRKARTISRLCIIPSSLLSALVIVINGARMILPASTILKSLSKYADSSLRLLEPWTTESGIRETCFPTELEKDLDEEMFGIIAVALNDEELGRLLRDACGGEEDGQSDEKGESDEDN